MSKQSTLIQPLPSETRSKIRSTQLLTSLPQVVSELLQNSLDAGAKSIEIGIDAENWSCWVRDDGNGITKNGLHQLAQEGEQGRYMSSKAYTMESLDDLSTFGFRGEALASAAELSCLEVSSRTASSRETWSIILRGGTVLYEGKAVRWRREYKGTVVSVKDAFYNLPVRRLSHPSASRTIQLVRQDLESFSLVFPEVTFSLLRTRDVGSSSAASELLLKIPPTHSTLKTFRHLYGKALASHVDLVDEVGEGDVRLSGFISLDGTTTKAHQYLYVNKHPLSYGDLHKLIDATFAASTFSKHAYDESGETDYPRSTTRRSPRKHEKRPVYVLNLAIPSRELDNCLEPSKRQVHLQHKDVIEKFLSSVIQGFLTHHGFSSRNEHQIASDRVVDTQSPSKRRRTMDFEDDSGYAEASFMTHGHIWEQDSTECIEDCKAEVPYVSTTEDGDVFWTDPNTGVNFTVDRRTGYSRAQTSSLENSESMSSLQQRFSLSLIAQSDKDKATTPVPHWIQKALKANNAFTPSEASIPSAPAFSHSTWSKTSSDQPTYSQHNCHISYISHQNQRSLFLSKAGASASFQLSKEDLRHAEVIQQVDKKFIACVVVGQSSNIPSDSERSVQDYQKNLILIDQHAADERVRVEKYLQSLCSGYLDQVKGNESLEKVPLEPSFPILLTSSEYSRLASSEEVQRVLSHWGICFDKLERRTDSDNDENGSEYIQAFVRSIPQILCDKLLLKDELRDVVKGFLARFEDNSFFSELQPLDGPDMDESKHEWLKALRDCPRELLELVNSKACRGAIMFNDPLTIEQCTSLVRKLAETVFPFQCAHGRPSLVPLNVADGLQESHCPQVKAVEWARLEKLREPD